MKKTLIIALLFIATIGYSQEVISPYFQLNESTQALNELTLETKNLLESNGFEIIGEYQPEGNPNLYVIAYTHQDLVKLCLNFKDRGLMAASLKVGFVKVNGVTKVSILNPEYQFIAYLYEGYDQYKSELKSISDLAIKALQPISKEMIAFGGEEKIEKLSRYRYKMMMPRFTDPVELNSYENFKAGLDVIRKNLENKVGNSVKVYELVDEKNQIAVFGIGLLDAEKGEGDFLPVIGENNIAGMPYDIVLQGKVASMLHGKYRFALHWPELTMGTFMKIMSTPKNVERFMEQIAK